MKARVAMAGLLALLTLPHGAAADDRTVPDPDDSPAAIDIASVRQGHYFEYVLYRVTAFERWQPADLESGRIVLAFNLDDDGEIERRGIIEYIGGGGSQMRSTVVDQNGELIGRAVHRRPTGRSIEVWFKRWQLSGEMRYRAFVTVETTDSDECSTKPCVDRAPDEGSLSHQLEKLCAGREPTIAGTAGDDRLRATRRSDVIDGRGGNDEIVGVSGNDVVCGGAGNDVIEGGSGYLFLRGGRGADRITATGPRPTACDDTGGNAGCAYPEAILVGGAGNDVLHGGRQHERLLGGGGNDILRGRRGSDGLDGGAGSDQAWGGRGTDSCRRAEERHSCEN